MRLPLSGDITVINEGSQPEPPTPRTNGSRTWSKNRSAQSRGRSQEATSSVGIIGAWSSLVAISNP